MVLQAVAAVKSWLCGSEMGRLETFVTDGAPFESIPA